MAPVRARNKRVLPEHVTQELERAVGTRRGGRLVEALAEASKAFERERFGDALKVLRPLVEEAPEAVAVRELTGLSLYRLGKWAEAIKHLQRFTELTGSVEQHPVLADAHRALGHHSTVAELWDELAASSPGAHLVAEGRIVMAGSLADQGRLADAIKLLERATMDAKRPQVHHLRMWYSLADLYERAGDVPRAREMFTRITTRDSEFVDVAERLAALA